MKSLWCALLWVSLGSYAFAQGHPIGLGSTNSSVNMGSSGVIPQYTAATTLSNSSPQLDNGVTTPNTLTYAGSAGIAAPQFTGTGPNAGLVGLAQGTAQTAVAHEFGFMANTSEPAAGMFWTAPSTANTHAGALFTIGAPSSGIAALTLLDGNTSGSQCFQENSSGVASWASCGSPTAATFYQVGSAATAGTAVGTANHAICGGINIPPSGLSVGHIDFNVTTGDGGSVTSDVGIYGNFTSGGTCTLSAHVGGQALSSTGHQYLALSGGTQTIPYGSGGALVCYVSSGTTLALSVAQSIGTWFKLQDVGAIGSSGALPASFTCPTLSSSTGAGNNNGAPDIGLSP